MVDLGLLILRATTGAIGIATAVLSLERALAISPHREWALGAVICEGVGGVLMFVGLGGPIGPGILAEVLVVVAVVSSAPDRLWDVSGRLGYFPALRAMSQLGSSWIAIPTAISAAALTVIGSRAWSLDGALGFKMPNGGKVVWFAYLVVSAVLVVLVRLLQASK